MDITEAQFSFNYDGEDFFVPTQKGQVKGCKWIPTNGPTEFIVVFVHDFGSFATHNHDVFSVLQDHGGAVYVTDHIGHGRSPGAILSITIDDICDEIGSVMSYAKKQYPTTPLFLYGQSAGALAIMKFILKKERKSPSSEMPTGVILESPWIASWEQRKVGLFETCFIWALSKIFPNLLLDTKYTYYTGETPKRYTTMVDHCPLEMPYMTPAFYMSAMSAITFVHNKMSDWPHSVPIYMAIGRDDTVYNSDQLVEFWSAQKKNLKPFDGRVFSCGHLITKERDREKFLQAILDFTSKHHGRSKN